MLDFEGLNYWAIVAAWVITIVIGAYWYSPTGFGKLWAKLSGVNHMKLPENEATRSIVAVAISSLLQVFALAVILNSLEVDSLLAGIGVTLFVWFGFTALTTIGNTLYQRLGWKFWWLNASFFLVVMTLSAIILTWWR